MSNNTRLYLALPVLLVLFLLPRGCDAVAAITHKAPDGCQQAVFSPESAPAGTHYFGDGAPNTGLSDADMVASFKQGGACDPFQISVREMIWGLLGPHADEAVRFARQQQLAGDMTALTAASKRINRIVDSSTFTVDRHWSGTYETLFAAGRSDGWHAFKLRKSRRDAVVLKQTTAGGREFDWFVICYWQPKAPTLPGFPVGPPPGAEVGHPGSPGGTVPPGTQPPGTHPPGTVPPHGGTTVPHHPPVTYPPHPTTTWKCQGHTGICGTPNSGPEQQPVQDNNPAQVAPTPGYTSGSAESTGDQHNNCAGQPGCPGVDSGGTAPGGTAGGDQGGHDGTGTPQGTAPPGTAPPGTVPDF